MKAAWWQAGFLLGLIEHDHRQMVCEARLPHVNQVLHELHAKSVPPPRSQSTNYKGAMPPDDSDDPDDSGAFHRLPFSSDTLQKTSSGVLYDHVPDSASTSSDSGRKKSPANDDIDSSLPVSRSYARDEVIVLTDKCERVWYCKQCKMIWPHEFFSRGVGLACDLCYSLSRSESQK